MQDAERGRLLREAIEREVVEVLSGWIGGAGATGGLPRWSPSCPA